MISISYSLYQAPSPYLKKRNRTPMAKKEKNEPALPTEIDQGKVKFEVYGEEMVEKIVKLSGNSGRVYLPPDWVGCRVKIIRMD
jgi:putative transposon-encoded protein